MLREAIQEIERLTERSVSAGAKLAIIDVPGMPRRRYIVDAEGKREELTLPEEPREHELGSVDQIASFVSRFAGDGFKFKPSVWFNAEGVEIVIDDGNGDDRRHRAKVEFGATEEFAQLQEWAESDRPMSAKEFIKLFKGGLQDTLDLESRKRLLTAVGVLKASTTESTQATNVRGRESLGREIDSEIHTNLDDIPEQIILKVRPFDDRSLMLSGNVRTQIDIDPRTLAFTLTPNKQDLEKVIELQLDALETQLTNELGSIPVHFGKP